MMNGLEYIILIVGSFMLITWVWFNLKEWK